MTTLGYLIPPGSGLADIRASGQLSRLTEQMRAYLQMFEDVCYFSYQRESNGVSVFASPSYSAADMTKLMIWPGRGDRRIYQFTMPFVQPYMRWCDLLYCSQATGAMPAMIARWRWGIPYVTRYGYEYARLARSLGQRGRALYLWLLERMAVRNAAAVVVGTDELDAAVRRYGVKPERIWRIHNGINRHEFVPTTYSSCAKFIPPVIVSVGRLEREKRHDLLIEALRHWPRAVELVLVGDGSQREALMRQAKQLGVVAYFYGVVPNHALPSVLRLSTVFALASPIEGQCKALVEALACGLPAVVADSGGTRCIVRDGVNGFLTPPGDVTALRVALHRVLTEHDLRERMATEARLSTIPYDLHDVREKELRMFRSVLDG